MSFTEGDLVLTLKSNTLESNTPSNFITHLKRHYHLEGKWTVALVEIQIPNTYENIGHSEYFTINYKNGKQRQVIMPAGRYENWGDLMAALNNLVPHPNSRLKRKAEEPLIEPERVKERANMFVPKGQLPQGIPIEDDDKQADEFDEDFHTNGSIPIHAPSGEPLPEEKPIIHQTVAPTGDPLITHDRADESKEVPKPHSLPLRNTLRIAPEEETHLNEDLNHLGDGGVMEENLDKDKEPENQQVLIGDLTPSKPADVLQFGYNEIRKRVIIEMDTDIIESVDFSKSLSKLLGLNALRVKGSAEGIYSVDVTNRHDCVYVYCSIIEPQVVGDEMAQLLRVVPLNSYTPYGELQTTTFSPVWYLRMSESNLSSIRVELRRESGEPVSFQFGSTIVTLHLRKVSERNGL